MVQTYGEGIPIVKWDQQCRINLVLFLYNEVTIIPLSPSQFVCLVSKIKFFKEISFIVLFASKKMDKFPKLFLNKFIKKLEYQVSVWILMTTLSVYVFFFFLRSAVLSFSMGPIHYSRDPQTSFFIKNFIKNRSHGTIHTFKNYVATVFSVFSKISGIQTHPKSEITSTKICPLQVLAFLKLHSTNCNLSS